jgi:hypothetical protein
MESSQPWWCKHHGETSMHYYIGKRVYAIHYNAFYNAEEKMWMIAYGASIYTTDSMEALWKEFEDSEYQDKTLKGITSTAKERFMRFPINMLVGFYPEIPENQRLTRGDLKDIMDSKKFWKKCCCQLGVKQHNEPNIQNEPMDSSPEETTVSLKKALHLSVSENHWITHKKIKKLRRRVRQSCHFQITTPTSTKEYFVSYRMLSSGEISFGYSISNKKTELSISEKDDLWIQSKENLRKNPIFTFSKKKQKEYLTNIFGPLIENQQKC